MEAARELLDQGADVNVENSRGSTPLHFAAAAKERTAEICGLLLDAGADSGIPDLQGRLPYELAESDDIRRDGLAGLADERRHACLALCLPCLPGRAAGRPETAPTASRLAVLHSLGC